MLQFPGGASATRWCGNDSKYIGVQELLFTTYNPSRTTALEVGHLDESSSHLEMLIVVVIW
jgi:hypothetical protein